MKVLVACEYSGIVRDAFIAAGHDALSCDLLPTERPGPHFQGDVRELLIADAWDLMVAHPPCTYLTKAAAHLWKDPERQKLQLEALAFARELLEAPVPRIALENPPGRIGTAIRKADQYVHPWMFGHPEWKHTGLWLKGLPKLKPTKVVPEAERRTWVLTHGPSPDRWKARSRTFSGLAAAMAAQWGALNALEEVV